MAITTITEPPQIHRLPQHKYVDAVRWLPLLSAFDRFAVLALFDSDSDSSSVEIHSLTPTPPALTSQSSWVSPSRVSSLKTSLSHQKTIVVASTIAGSLHVLFSDPMDASLESEISVADNALHVGTHFMCRFDGWWDGVSKWASPMEFATGGYGFSLQWWDQRKPGGPVSQFKGNWAQRMTSGIVHSIDIHPSRKHTCLAGGSLGTVFAWDLRWQEQPIILSGVGTGDSLTRSTSESEVWEVQYDRYMKSTNLGNISSARVLPAMICSEDGILAVVEQGEEPIELLTEPCAINSFDIDRHNPSDVICGLEWESVAILTRS
ncbi:Nuclear pore complex protein NUP43 [Quillaja saponaria]|uniref:Nuclear pore complex protein NUP43 n=1 Tax=Quillaja saponaria TaxID=32244 RepID=A0AAD7QDK8_QUISA|nr:Nuclear pore complex protein NUP43 [Quillaja saponaria]